ncbi:amidohydrolase family protein [Mesorhizobium sp. A623]
MSDVTKVDMHAHLFPSHEVGFEEKRYSVWEYGDFPEIVYSPCSGVVDEIQKQMSETGISKAVLLIYFKALDSKNAKIQTISSRSSSDKLNQEEIDAIDRQVVAELAKANRWGCSISAQYPNISTFVTVDINIQTPEAAAEHVLDLARNHGAKGVKLHSALQGFSMSDRRLWPLYRKCEKAGLPVLGHGGPDRDGRGISDPNAFAEMLQAFPNLPVVIAHMGGAAWRQTAAIAQAHKNAVFDCSEIIHWTGAPNAPTDDELASLIKEVGSERVMMGSDFPWYDLDATVERVLALPRISDRDKEGILGANAVRILGL